MKEKTGSSYEKKDLNAETPKARTTTLKELGRQLPVGTTVNPGKLNKAFDYHGMRTKDERAIAKRKKAKETQQQYVSHVLAQMLDRIGDFEFGEGVSPQEREVRIGQLYMGDVMYAYLHLRCDIIGSDIPLNITCASCKKEFTWVADLESTEVACINEEADMAWQYTLKDPIKIRGLEVTSLRVSQPRWFAVSNMENDDDLMVKISTVRGSILGLNDDKTDVQLTDQEVDEISKRDLEGLSNGINRNFVGPAMIVEGECPKCGQRFVRPIIWYYDSFFATSSL